jgi:hypothetical protein
MFRVNYEVTRIFAVFFSSGVNMLHPAVSWNQRAVTLVRRGEESEYFSIQCCSIFERFPGFVRVPFWQEQHVR